MRAILGALLMLVLTATGGSAMADQGDPRLDHYFDQLKSVSDAAEARQIEHSIWMLWGQSGSDTVDLLMARGEEAMAARAFDKALALFNAVIEYKPDFAEGWNRRATLHFLVGAYVASIKDIDRTLALEPRHFGALSGLGLVNIALDRLEAALDAFRRALAVNPQLQGTRQNIKALEKKIRGEAI